MHAYPRHPKRIPASFSVRIRSTPISMVRCCARKRARYRRGMRRTGLVIGSVLVSVPWTTGGCVEQAPDADVDYTHPAGPFHTAPEVTQEEAPSSTSVRERLRTPLSALAEVEGPTPLFEALDDPAGRRYVVGEGAYSESEQGESNSVSGLFTASRRPMTDDELAEEAAYPKIPLLHTGKLADDLKDRAAAAQARGSTESVEVLIEAGQREEGLLVAKERLIAEGEILDEHDLAEWHDILVEERQDRVLNALAPVIAAVEGRGGSVSYQCRNRACLVATVPARDLVGLSEQAEVRRISSIPEPGSGRPTGDGVEIRHGAQMTQFLEHASTFDGNGASDSNETDNIVVGVIELNTSEFGAEGFDTDHAGFRESGPTSSFRYSLGTTGRWNCTLSGCSQVTSFTSSGSHATGVAGILFGDLQQGQHTSITDPTVRKERSGYAREARGHMFLANGANGAIQAMDTIAGLTSNQYPPHLVSNSYGFQESSWCRGGGTSGGVLASRANTLYEDGIAVIASAGNDGGSTSTCRVLAPGSAIGAFTVGAHLQSHVGADATDVRTAGIYSVTGGKKSAWGGNPSQGQNRSIIDVTGPGAREHKFNSSGGFISGGGGVNATSLAAPTVAGAAAIVMDQYFIQHSTWLDNPGALYTTMLLMGDRQRYSGGKGGSSPDHLWGTGRLRARMLNSQGMDPPYYWFNGWTCISHLETYDFLINSGSALSTDTEEIKIAAYWYDTRHETTGAVANVNMKLYTTSGTQLNYDNDPNDNKAFLFEEGIGGKALKLRFTGTSVSGHTDPVCGSNSIRVYFAFFAEDNDRESPTYNTSTGQGVYPESL